MGNQKKKNIQANKRENINKKKRVSPEKQSRQRKVHTQKLKKRKEEENKVNRRKRKANPNVLDKNPVKNKGIDNIKNKPLDIKETKEIINIAYTMIGLFILVLGYFVIFMFTKSEDVINNTYNKRQDLLAEHIVRGKIISSDGKTLAHTVVNEDGSEKRVYPYGDMFAHSVGRFSKGRTGVELSENYRLLTSNNNGLKKIFMELTGQKNIGDNVITTLNYDLQRVAYEGLGNNKGAIVVMEPSSGKILAMVSKPAYDPNKIDSTWEEIKDDNVKKQLTNRVSQEAYPPGSIFKVVTLLEYIRENPDYNNYSYECNGKYAGAFGEITCGKAHGKVNLKESLAYSCNTSFANIGESLNSDKFKESIASLQLDTYIPTNIDYNHPFTAIGQGDVMVSPMQMATLTSAIANGGIAMKPYIVDHIENSDGNTIKKFLPEMENTLISTTEAEIVTEYMEEVVQIGTASGMKNNKYTVAAKTGTAQNKIGSKSHSWFIGFANTKSPEIAVAIIVENVGSGSKYAVPIANNIFKTYFNQ